MDSVINYLLHSIPLIVALILWAVRLEKKITRVETDISWIRETLPRCQPASAKPTH